MDADCKHKAGALGGIAKGVLKNLVTKVALCDESEAYHIDQAVAAFGGVGGFQTVIFFGDQNQRFEDFNTNPAFTRCPWLSTSSRDGPPGPVAPSRFRGGDPLRGGGRRRGAWRSGGQQDDPQREAAATAGLPQ